MTSFFFSNGRNLSSYLIIMTKIDEICPLVNKDLKNVYKSKKIKEKVSIDEGATNRNQN